MFESLLDDWLFVRLVKNLGAGQLVEELWEECLVKLGKELSEEHYEIYIRPLQSRIDEDRITLLAPNIYVEEQIRKTYLDLITEVFEKRSRETGEMVGIELVVGDRVVGQPGRSETVVKESFSGVSNLNSEFKFDSYVVGSTNELAIAGAKQVAENAGVSYNPLLIYGGVGLGKTHLMHAVGNEILARDPGAKVLYLHSQKFVQDMIKALQQGKMQDFMQYYRSVDALLIDDVQFFARKLKSQEEFFHVFNALLEGGHQMVMSSDKYPREIEGLEERLKSRFVWGLTVEIEPPELETRVAILLKKAEAEKVELDTPVAFFIAERIRSNVRELEGALRRVIANARFTGSKITIEQVKRALRDLFAIQDRQISIDNIQKTVALYFNIKIADMVSKRRNRTVARPRQMAMALAKELTNHSLPEIGDAFGGRDHTTVLHACRKINELKEATAETAEDHKNLVRLLSA